MIQCSADTPWGFHPALRGDRCPRCGFEAREIDDSVERRVHHPAPRRRVFGRPLLHAAA
jgi:hypothetical protein